MHLFSGKISCWLTALRAYSLPISIMSWFVPFLYGLFSKGSFVYGIIALFGIIILHLASNLFDDTIDYILVKRKIDKGLQSDFNFQPGKCICLFDGSLSIKEYIIACGILFLLAGIIGFYFIYLYGFELLAVIVPAALLCILYPVLGCLGLGEIIIAIVFAPLLYSGVFFVMTGGFSYSVLLFSVSTGLLSVAVLHNHMLLDYKLDVKNRKITLCRLCSSPERAYILLCAIVMAAYLNIILWVLLSKISYIYLITLLSLPTAYTLLKVMYVHIKSPDKMIIPNIFMGDLSGLKKVDESQKNFLMKFFIVRNLLSSFTLLLCISIVVEKCIL